MAVILRLRRMGAKKHPFYRIVAAESRYQRDGRFLETLGNYDPLKKPFTVNVDREKILAWLNKGARMSDTVEGLLRKEGIVQEYNLAKVESKKKSSASAPVKEEKADAGNVEVAKS